jgi:transcriptional regulator with XRE-family HTH domain
MKEYNRPLPPTKPTPTGRAERGENSRTGASMRYTFRPVLLKPSRASTNLNKTREATPETTFATIPTPPYFDDPEANQMPRQKPVDLVDLDELQEAMKPTAFQPGNQAAAKPRWPEKRLQKFADELRTFRDLIGFNYSEMGRALGVSGQYVKLIERAERQPSDKFVRLFRTLKATSPANQKGERLSSEALEHLGEIWDHVLAHKFKCPGCAKEVRQGTRHKGLEYWWGMPNQKYCEQHSKRKPKPRT